MSNLNLKGAFLKGRALKIITMLLNGDRRLAIGTVIEFWELAQDYWADGEKLIPHNVYSNMGFPKEFYNEEINIAEYREEGIYARGSKEQFDWLLQRRKAGKLGGLAAQEMLRKMKQKQSDRPSECSNPASDVEAAAKASLLPFNNIKEDIKGFSEKPALHWLAEIWNTETEKNGNQIFAKVHKTSGQRSRIIAARIKENPEKDFWLKVIQGLMRDPWYRGEDPKCRPGWKADFDFILQAGKALRIFEKIQNEKPRNREHRYGMEQK